MVSQNEGQGDLSSLFFQAGMKRDEIERQRAANLGALQSMSQQYPGVFPSLQGMNPDAAGMVLKNAEPLLVNQQKIQQAAAERRKDWVDVGAFADTFANHPDLDPSVMAAMKNASRAGQGDPSMFKGFINKFLERRSLGQQAIGEDPDIEKPGQFKPDANKKVDIRYDANGMALPFVRDKSGGELQRDLGRAHQYLAEKYKIDVMDPSYNDWAAANITDPRDMKLRQWVSSQSQFMPQTVVPPLGTVGTRGGPLDLAGQAGQQRGPVQQRAPAGWVPPPGMGATTAQPGTETTIGVPRASTVGGARAPVQIPGQAPPGQENQLALLRHTIDQLRTTADVAERLPSAQTLDGRLGLKMRAKAAADLGTATLNPDEINLVALHDALRIMTLGMSTPTMGMMTRAPKLMGDLTNAFGQYFSYMPSERLRVWAGKLDDIYKDILAEQKGQNQKVVEIPSSYTPPSTPPLGRPKPTLLERGVGAASRVLGGPGVPQATPPSGTGSAGVSGKPTEQPAVPQTAAPPNSTRQLIEDWKRKTGRQ